MGDNIKKPDHYCAGRKYEPKDVIRDWGLNFNLGSAVKYISRAGRKGDKLEDLEKAREFLNFEIEVVEKKKNSEIEIEKEHKTCFYVNGLLSQFMDYDYILNDEYKHRAIDKIAQEVLDSQCDIENDIPTDKLRDIVIDRIVERINNDELDCFDIPGYLYSGYQDIRYAIARQAFRKEGEEQKSDSGMTCREAAEIGDAIPKGFEESFTLSFKEELEQEDVLPLADTISMIMKHNRIPEPDVIKLQFKFEDDPTAIPTNTVSIKFHTTRKEI